MNQQVLIHWINFAIEVINNTIPNTSPIFISKEPINNSDSNKQQNIQLNNNQVSQITTNNIPKILHFIHFGYTEFTFIHYYAIKTAFDNNTDYKIYLYNYIKPNNIWFQLNF